MNIICNFHLIFLMSYMSTCIVTEELSRCRSVSFIYLSEYACLEGDPRPAVKISPSALVLHKCVLLAPSAVSSTSKYTKTVNAAVVVVVAACRTQSSPTGSCVVSYVLLIIGPV